jgi:sugar phosphate isomerase/epimerase
MKLAFSTLGCPEWTFTQILESAVRLGYQGIEFRGIGPLIELPEVPEFAPAQIEATRRQLDEAGMAVACLASSVSIVAAQASLVDRQKALASAQRYVELAQVVGASQVRLFCGDVPGGMARDEALAAATDSLQALGEFAQARGVKLAVETHDAFTRTELLMELIRRANHPAVGVLWDIHHPYRVAGESIAHSLHYLDGKIIHTHVKDSVLHEDGEGFTYVPIGHGDVPLLDALQALKTLNYAGFVTLEWEKRWHPVLEAPEVVFPQYAAQMKAWLAQLA